MWHVFGSSSCRSVAKFARMLKIYILLCAQQESIGSQNLTLSPATELSCTLKTASDWLAYTKSHGVCLAPANLDAKPNRHNKLYRCFLPIEVWPCNESHLCEITTYFIPLYVACIWVLLLRLLEPPVFYACFLEFAVSLQWRNMLDWIRSLLLISLN